MSEPQNPNPTSVTGIASGGLGTAANLEDTQLWSLDDLREPDADLAPVPDVVHEPVAAAAPEPVVARQPSQPAPAAASAPVVGRNHDVVPRRSRARTGVLAAAAVGVLALAAMLAMRDGLPGGAATGSGDASAAFPSLPAATVAPAATAPDAAGSGGGGKGKGNGNGKGNGGKGN